MKTILCLGLLLQSAASFAAGCGGMNCPPRTHCINNTLCSPNLNPDSELKGTAVWLLPLEQKALQTPACESKGETSKI